jgi:hypothetical protein
LGIFIATEDDSLLGYLMAETMDFASQSPLIEGMTKRFPAIQYQHHPLTGSRLFIYGPVCIARKYRGQGILEGLFNIMRQTLSGKYDVWIAFVSKNNPHSLRAHTEKLGMTVADEFEFKGQMYWTIAFRV